MKRIIVALSLLVPGLAQAAPYFRILDISHPQIIAGVWADPTGREAPSYGSAVALITHKAGEGGALIESIQADWSPLAVGGGYGNGEAFAAVGPSANILPVAKALAVRGLDLLGKDYENLRQLLSPVPGAGPDISVALGPQFLIRPIEGGQLLAPEKYRGRFSLFAGAAWKF